MEPRSTVDPPSHEDDVRRGLGQSAPSPKVEITNFTPDEDAAILALATAMEQEYNFFSAPQRSWTLAAAGVLRKMGATVTSGESGVVITIPR